MLIYHAGGSACVTRGQAAEAGLSKDVLAFNDPPIVSLSTRHSAISMNTIVSKQTTSLAKGRKAIAPDIKREREIVMKALHPVVQMLGGIVGPHIEVVLHDQTKPEHSVVAIANGHVTGRTLGSSILSGPKDDVALVEANRELHARGVVEHAVIAKYTTENAAGQLLRSATVVFRDSTGEPFAALCLNCDQSMFQAAYSWLERVLNMVPAAEAPKPTHEPELDARMKEIIADAVTTFGKPTNMMNKEEKIFAVQLMQRRGLFIVRGGVERAASALGVTRFTIYNYLEELRRRDGAEAEVPAASPAPRSRAQRKA